MNISCEHAAQLVDILAHPVGPEVLKASGASSECEEEFQNATQAFNGKDYRDARDHYCRAHQLMGLPKERSSSALRNASLCLYHLGKYDESFNEMLPWFRARILHGPAIWNFAMAAIRAEKYETGVEALTEWKERAVEYLLPRASVLGAAILGCLGRNPDAEDWLQEGLEADSSYVNARLRQIGLLSKETKPAAVVDARDFKNAAHDTPNAQQTTEVPAVT
jgi:tetratricopeptide (TPR) repeat protein